LQAEQRCPVEVKLLLSPPELHTIITSLEFGKETAGRVYFFDTDQLALLKQNVIIRVRQGADNDLTVKVRVPEVNAKPATNSHIRELFPCEIARTGAGEDTDYSVRRKYTPTQVPLMGSDISSQLSPPQKRLLQEAGVSIDWSQVRRIADIKLTKWETGTQPPFRKLALELWECPAVNILEVSAKVAPDEGQSKYVELQRLVSAKQLALNARQSTKTSLALEAITHPTSPPK
jgi:hypothetical protein